MFWRQNLTSFKPFFFITKDFLDDDIKNLVIASCDAFGGDIEEDYENDVWKISTEGTLAILRLTRIGYPIKVLLELKHGGECQINIYIDKDEKET